MECRNGLSKKSEKVLLKGNEVMSMAAIEAGCKFFSGYPITPQNEVPEYFATHLRKAGGVFVQAESEVGAINMMIGAAATGTRCMTSSSSPGVSLKLEGISYLAGAELPCVIANMQRGGPGLANISAAQSDYFQAVKGGGHGGYKMIVLTPATLAELYELTMNAFDYADYYRIPVMILGDGILGQMSEPVTPTSYKPIMKLPKKDYIIGQKETTQVQSLRLIPPNALELHNRDLAKKYAQIESELTLCDHIQTDDAELVIAAYGSTARIAKGAVAMARAKGMKVGLIRPVTVWPFPDADFMKVAKQVDKFLVVEMSNGQLVEDVERAIRFSKPVEFFGVGGGWYPTPEEIFEQIQKLYG